MRSSSGVVRGSAAALAALICCLLPAIAAPTYGASWETRQLPGEAAGSALFGVSCPTASLCVAVGSNNAIASSTDPTGAASSWKVVYPGEGPLTTSSGFFSGRQIRGVSCPSQRLCVAVSFDGKVYTATDPTGGAGAWRVADLSGDGPNAHFYGVSCPTESFCAASAGGAKVATTVNPTGGAGAWTVTQLEAPMELRGIDCASAALCVAVGDDGDNIRPEPTEDRPLLASSTAPLGGAWSKALLPGLRSMYGVACPSRDLCVSGDTLGNLLVATDPAAGAGAWRQIDGGGSVQITDVDCVSSSLCLAVDNNGDVLTSERPDGGPADWSFANIAPYPGVDGTMANALFGASCPSRSLCAIAANDGHIFTSADPFAASADGSPVATGRRGKRRHRRPRPKRPRVTIAAVPKPGIELGRRRHVTVRYRFFARRHAQVRGFLCKLDRRPLRRCRPPKTYRVGFGRHVFRVRAIGWTGKRGPVAVDRFRVCHPTPYGECIRHLPPPKHR